ncbi:MAG: amino acid--tRNA ligase-related protein [Nitrososphaerota archaeon]
MAWVFIQKETGNGIGRELLTHLSQTSNRYHLFKYPALHAVARIESSLLAGARRYFYQKGFTEITIPHITRATGACENISTMFEVDFFGKRRYLAQTGQLYLEVLTQYLEKVFAIGPSFRAEPSADSRHLVEFTLIEIEFRGGFEELLNHIEGTIASMVDEVLMRNRADLEYLAINSSRLKLSHPFKRITYSEAVEILADKGVRWGDDLKSDHERYLVKHFGDQPLFVTHYPKKIKFFNMRENAFDQTVVNSADLLLPYSGEAVGAAEREFDHAKLTKRLLESTMFNLLREKGGSLEDFDWYLNFYKEYQGTLHSGCGIGLNRVTQFVLGLDDIRQCTVWPMNIESDS